MTEQQVPVTTNPWEKYGWLMGAIWLVFLGFPITAAVTAPAAVGWRVLTVGLIVAFAGTYIYGFRRLDRFDTWREVNVFGWRILAVLVLLVLSTAPVIGPQAMGMIPFLVAFPMFALPLRWAAAVGVVGILSPLVIALAVDAVGEIWFIIPIAALVFTATGLVRLLERGQAEHQQTEAELTLAAERDRVARDVHDVLGHSLTVVTVKAELAQRLVDADPERAKDELEQIRSLSREALAEIRATVSGLRVARLAEELDRARSALSDAGISADLPDDPAVIDPRHRIVVAWVLREAVTNVVRHSGASHCIVEFDSCRLTVLDDGRGTNGRRESNGLRGVRERVTGAGGTVELGPGPEGGTKVEVLL